MACGRLASWELKSHGIAPDENSGRMQAMAEHGCSASAECGKIRSFPDYPD